MSIILTIKKMNFFYVEGGKSRVLQMKEFRIYFMHLLQQHKKSPASL